MTQSFTLLILSWASIQHVSLSLSPSLSIYIYIYIYPHTHIEEPKIILFTNPSARAGYDTRSIFKRSLTGFNSEFSFS